MHIARQSGGLVDGARAGAEFDLPAGWFLLLRPNGTTFIGCVPYCNSRSRGIAHDCSVLLRRQTRRKKKKKKRLLKRNYAERVMYRADAYFSHAINNACACCAWRCTPGWTLSCIMLSCIMPSWTLPATGHARTGIRGHAAARSLGLDYMQVEGIHHDALSNIRSSHPPARPWPWSPGRQTGFGDINNFGDPEEVHAWHAGRSCRGRVVDGAAGRPASSAAQRSVRGHARRHLPVYTAQAGDVPKFTKI